MAVKCYNDNGRFLLIIEPVDDEAEKLIKEIKKVCGIERDSVSSIKGLMPAPISSDKEKSSSLNSKDAKTIKTDEPAEHKAEKDSQKPSSNDGVGAGYKAYYETMKKLRNNELSGEEKKVAVTNVKAFAERLKEIVPSGANLQFVVENLSEMFSKRIEDAVLDKMGISKAQLLLGDDNLYKEAYRNAILIGSK